MLKNKLRDLVDRGTTLPPAEKEILVQDLFRMINNWIAAPQDKKKEAIRDARNRSLARLGLEPRKVPILIRSGPGRSEQESRNMFDYYTRRLTKRLRTESQPSAQPALEIADIANEGSSFVAQAWVVGGRLLLKRDIRRAIARTYKKPFAQVRLIDRTN